MADAAGARFGVAVLADAGTDSMTIYRSNLRAIEDALESLGLVWRGQGLLSARPAAAVQGGVYKPTDSGLETVLYYDTGAGWVTIGAGATVDDAAGVGSLRTIGAGALQAASGAHTHGDDVYQYALMGAT